MIVEQMILNVSKRTKSQPNYTFGSLYHKFSHYFAHGQNWNEKLHCGQKKISSYFGAKMMSIISAFKMFSNKLSSPPKK